MYVLGFLYIHKIYMRLILSCFLLFTILSFGQLNKPISLEFNYLKGNILPHKKGLDHLITGHPEGVMLSVLKQSDGSKEWQKDYNYPEYGAYFLYQDFKNDILGQNYAAGFQSNFYFLKRNIQFKVASGIAMTTHPYDKETNSKNNAFGSKFMANINIGLAYKTYFFNKKIAAQTGFFFSHYSNGRTKSPNSGINTINLNIGLAYNLSTSKINKKDSVVTSIENSKEPIHYNVVVRSGLNESSVVNSGQHSFYHIGFFANKKLNKKTTLQLGTELFLSNFYKDFIKYQSIAYPNKQIDANTDYKRVGVFIGYELFFDKVAVEAQAGYYVYQPFKFDIPIYDRIGIKYYFNKKINVGISVKTHGFLAEAFEFNVGTRF